MEGTMAFRGEQVIGGNIYVYEAVAVWNPEKKRSEQKRVYIGSKNKNGDFIPNKKYHELYGYDANDKQPAMAVKALDYGTAFLFESISKRVGLTGVLQECFPDKWQEILACAWHSISEHEAMYLCEQWAESTQLPEGLKLSSQRLSEMIKSFDENSRINFYRKWAALRIEKEYLVLDITSVSSYSEMIQYMEYGYNRDKDDLPQINMALVFGEKSRLPIYSRVYPGSIKDVSTLRGMSELLKNELNLKSMNYVMDKGFYKEQTIKHLLNEKIRFAISIPFTTSLASNAVLEYGDTITNPANAIEMNKHLYYAKTIIRTIDRHRVYIHIYFDPERRAAEQTAFMHKILKMESDFIDNKISEDDPLFRKYFTLRKTKTGINIHRNEEAINKRLDNSGYFVAMTNDSKDSRYVLQVYRTKDCVEKAFENIKNDLDMKRLRIHSDEAMQGRIFIIFIALIISSYIRYIMKEADLYKKFTFSALIKELKKLKVIRLSNKKTLMTELTRSQKIIFKAFDAMPSIL
jgi:transposase